MSFVYVSDHMEKDKLRPLYYVGAWAARET